MTPEELEFVAIAIPLHVYHAQKANKLSFLPGETMSVCASKAFAEDDYWLGQKPCDNAYGLIPKKHVELREHEFGFERDFDDNASTVCLLMAYQN